MCDLGPILHSAQPNDAVSHPDLRCIPLMERGARGHRADMPVGLPRLASAPETSVSFLCPVCFRVRIRTVVF